MPLELETDEPSFVELSELWDDHADELGLLPTERLAIGLPPLGWEGDEWDPQAELDPDEDDGIVYERDMSDRAVLLREYTDENRRELIAELREANQQRRRRDLALMPPAVLRSIAIRAGCQPRRGALPRRSSSSKPGSSSSSRRARSASRGSPGRQSGDDPHEHEHLDSAEAVS